MEPGLGPRPNLQSTTGSIPPARQSPARDGPGSPAGLGGGGRLPRGLEAANCPAFRRQREMNQLPAPPTGPHVTPGEGRRVGGTALSHRRYSPVPPLTPVVPRVVRSARRHLLGKRVPPPGLQAPLGLVSRLLLRTGARFPVSPSLFPGLREPQADPKTTAEDNRGPGRLWLTSPRLAPPTPHRPLSFAPPPPAL